MDDTKAFVRVCWHFSDIHDLNIRIRRLQTAPVMVIRFHSPLPRHTPIPFSNGVKFVYHKPKYTETEHLKQYLAVPHACQNV